MNQFYQAAEDSYQLLEDVQEYLQDQVPSLTICEVGVGSGIISSSLAKQFCQHNYFGSDINLEAIKETRRRFKEIKATIKLSNKAFFSGFKNKKFDVVFFNTPYLPCEDGDNYDELTDFDKAIYGGKHGYEVIFEFLKKLNDSLVNSGVCFMLCSNLSKQENIEELLQELCFNFELISTTSHFFEELYVYKITKSPLLKELSNLNLTQILPFSAGKHSQVLQANLKRTKVMIKIGKPQHLQKEVLFLKKFQPYSFSTTLLDSGENFVVYKKIHGSTIEEYFSQASKEEMIQIMNSSLKATMKLDILGITKFELTNPYKHIFIQKDFSIKMIDFERCIYATSPKNTTQFLQYIHRNIPRLQAMGFKISKEKILEVGRLYSQKKMKKITFEDLLSSSQ